MLQFAHSTLLIKSVDDEQRIIEGIASNTRPDRDGDILESTGAQFTLPMPFLWQHNQGHPLGHIIAANVVIRQEKQSALSPGRHPHPRADRQGSRPSSRTHGS